MNGTAIPNSTLWSALPIAYQLTHIPATFGYPIYHYAQIKGVLQNPAIGSTLELVITNRDGQSSSRRYILPARWEDLDSDSDGLLDRWEDGVYTAPGGGTVNLAAMGASKYKKDILMEADWTSRAAPGSTGVGYDDSTWGLMETFFSDAPVLNPDGTPGIRLIIDRGQGGPFTGGGTVLNNPDGIRVGFEDCPGGDCSNYGKFMDYRDAHFAPERIGLFRYLVISMATSGGGAGGEARFPYGPTVPWSDIPNPNCPECGGDNLLMGVVGSGWNNSINFANVTVHELGHNIGLSHGGTWRNWNHDNWKPNFHSIMNYRYDNGVPPGCDLTGPGEANYSSNINGRGPDQFSSGILAPLNQNLVDENLGICDRSTSDLSWDGQITAGPMQLPACCWGRPTSTTVHEDHDQWGHIVLDFAACWANNQVLVRWSREWTC